MSASARIVRIASPAKPMAETAEKPASTADELQRQLVVDGLLRRHLAASLERPSGADAAFVKRVMAALPARPPRRQRWWSRLRSWLRTDEAGDA